MNETMVYADGFEKTFATAEEMLDFLSRRGKASEWIRKPIRALRLVPLEKEAKIISIRGECVPQDAELLYYSDLIMADRKPDAR